MSSPAFPVGAVEVRNDAAEVLLVQVEQTYFLVSCLCLQKSSSEVDLIVQP